jgi:hypothetical protein
VAQVQENIGLIRQDEADLDWETGLNAGIIEANVRLTLTYDGDPNGNVAGFWLGQTVWDFTNETWWICTVATEVPGSTVWTALEAILSNLTLTSLTTGTLTVTGAADLQDTLAVAGLSTLAAQENSGLISANGGILLPAGEVIQGEPGEKWLTDGVLSTNPVNHVAEHKDMGDAQATMRYQGYSTSRTGINVNDPSTTGFEEPPGGEGRILFDFASRSGPSYIKIGLVWLPQGTGGATMEARIVRRTPLTGDTVILHVTINTVTFDVTWFAGYPKLNDLSEQDRDGFGDDLGCPNEDGVIYLIEHKYTGGSSGSLQSFAQDAEDWGVI